MGGRLRKRVAGIIAEEWACGESVHLRVQRATGLSRFRGMIGREALGVDEAMFFERCRSVHGMFMDRPIVAVFLDDELRVTSVRLLKPWRLVFDRSARHVLEMEPPIALTANHEWSEKNFFAQRGANFARSNP